MAGPVASPSAEATRPPVAVRQAWARLIRQIYAADPLVCPRCGGRMKVIAVIEQAEVIFRILSHLGLVPAEDPSRTPPDDITLPAAPKELAYVPVFDLPVRRTQTGDLPFPESA